MKRRVNIGSRTKERKEIFKAEGEKEVKMTG